MNKLIDIFCDVDDFYHQFFPVWEAKLIANRSTKQKRKLEQLKKLSIKIISLKFLTAVIFIIRRKLSLIAVNVPSKVYHC
ncbi:hypothetical protein SAMN05216262_106101 [Colwellia chukchiensis]|uniref:Uncharacterized protein n=1 Tax=Colwellia chukchiensis TaxID=641665 RepID=A0A1H7MSV0_9GAMM|nr:hypothetical protein SAMN05216262_106101 [Colwellia chukchiensis]